jgi:hypothetical protein
MQESKFYTCPLCRAGLCGSGLLRAARQPRDLACRGLFMKYAFFCRFVNNGLGDLQGFWQGCGITRLLYRVNIFYNGFDPGFDDPVAQTPFLALEISLDRGSMICQFLTPLNKI